MSAAPGNIGFVIDCCRGKPVAEHILRDHLTDHEVRALTETAQQHGILPLVARMIGASHGPVRGHPAIQKMLRSADAIALRNQYLVEQLGAVLNHFERAGIETLVIKGPALASLAYGEIGLRSFGDLDLVVHPDDRSKAERVLGDLGFLSSLYDREAVESGFFDAIEANFHRDEDKVNIDLHWDLMPHSFALGPLGEAIWPHAIQLNLGKTQVRTLSHEDHLLYLTVHSARHGWESLSQVCDVAYFLERQSIDWRILLDRAEEMHCHRLFALAAHLAEELIGTQIPSPIREALGRDGSAAKLAKQLGREFRAGRKPGSAMRVLRTLKLMDYALDRSRYIATSVFAPTLMDRCFLSLPRSLYPVYFLIRPIRLASAIAQKRR